MSLVSVALLVCFGCLVCAPCSSRLCLFIQETQWHVVCLAGASLEEAEEQARKGKLFGKVGNELRPKSDSEARNELQEYFDHLGSP